MRKFRTYLILAGVVFFVAYFGVYELYWTIVLSVGEGWALAGAGLIAIGTFIIAAVGIAMIQSQVPDS
jgi:hypothetical protein